MSASGQSAKAVGCILSDPSFRFEHTGTMHLPHSHQRGTIDAEGTGEIFPALLIIVTHAFQREVTCAEAMRRNRGERRASKSGSPGLLHPLEVAARLW